MWRRPTPFPGGQEPRSPHPVTTCMLSCPGPEPDVVQLLQAGCETVRPGSLSISWESWVGDRGCGGRGSLAPLVSPSGEAGSQPCQGERPASPGEGEGMEQGFTPQLPASQSPSQSPAWYPGRHLPKNSRKAQRWDEQGKVGRDRHRHSKMETETAEPERIETRMRAAL